MCYYLFYHHSVETFYLSPKFCHHNKTCMFFFLHNYVFIYVEEFICNNFQSKNPGLKTMNILGEGDFINVFHKTGAYIVDKQ